MKFYNIASRPKTQKGLDELINWGRSWNRHFIILENGRSFTLWGGSFTLWGEGNGFQTKEIDIFSPPVEMVLTSWNSAYEKKLAEEAKEAEKKKNVGLKVDEKTRKLMVANMRDGWREIDTLVKGMIELVKSAKSVEEIMNLKKSILLKIFNPTFISSDNCYFCTERFDKWGAVKECKGCRYSKIHGKCNEKDSDWRIIRDKLYDLINAIETNYVKKDESYV